MKINITLTDVWIFPHYSCDSNPSFNEQIHINNLQYEQGVQSLLTNGEYNM